MNYGQSQAVMVLAGQRMGITMPTADLAKQLLAGEPVHVIYAAQIENDAVQLNNRLRSDANKIAEANRHCAALIAEYKLA